MITLAIPLKNCKQCSHYRGGFCYGFGTAKKVFSESEALLCGSYTPLGQVQIGPLDSLAGQLTAFQIPDGIISSLKLADLAVTVAKLGLSSVIDAKVAAGAAIAESKLSLTFGTQALHDDIQERALLAVYLAHDHSPTDPTQVDFNNLLNINPLDLSGDLSLIVGKKLILDKDADGNNYIYSPTDGYVSLFVENIEVLRVYSTMVNATVGFAFGNNKLLNLGYPTGASLYHTGALCFLNVVIGSMYLQTVANIYNTLSGFFRIRDKDDENAVLLELDTSARTFKVGIATDPIESTFTGNIAVTGNVDGVDVSEEPARIDQHLIIESENAEWINCPYEGSSIETTDIMTILGDVTPNAGCYITFSVPLPTNRGGKKLYVNGTRVSLSGASANNHVTGTAIYGKGASTGTQLDNDPTDKNSIALWEDTSMGALDCSSYHAIKVRLLCGATGADLLKIQYVTVRYYYA